MENKEILNEEKYQRTSKGLFFAGIGLIIFGIVIFMIIFIPKAIGGNKTSKEQLQQKLEQLKPGLEQRYSELKSKGVVESWDYKNKEGYEMHLIDIALNPTYDACEESSIYSDNSTTREYCKIKAQIYDADSYFANGRIMFTLVPALMALLPCLTLGSMLIMTSKRREILAFHAQQVMPVAQEGIEKMAPTIGKAGASIAKEISKGVKEGLKDQDNTK